MHKKIINFWFNEISKSNWFKKDKDFDNLLIKNFSTIHAKAAKCELYKWRQTAEGRLAEIIILDQFSRNMFRDSAESFAYDSVALALAQEAISVKADQDLTQIQRGFLYMPFMHSESLEIHETAVELYEKNGIEANLEYEKKHQEIIKKYGRYPHRNEILGRKSTREEEVFLRQPNSSF
jgi:uncharacterized protein (DUF924 family)